eukprot:s568_g13.t1
MARVGKDGYVRRIAGYDTEDDDTRERYVSWVIFEIKFGTTVDRASREEEELTHARLHMVRACVYHVNQRRISSAAGICGEAIATMVWECMKYQVDIIAGDGNKACYYPTPAKPCVPTYEVSLIQFWIDRIMNCATQERLKNFQPDAAPIRVKHFITASFTDLMFLKEKLFRVTTDKYTEKLSNETDKGDCCMMSIVEWGHARVVIEEYPENFDDETHMDEVGEFNFEALRLDLEKGFHLAPGGLDSRKGDIRQLAQDLVVEAQNAPAPAPAAPAAAAPTTPVEPATKKRRTLAQVGIQAWSVCMYLYHVNLLPYNVGRSVPEHFARLSQEGTEHFQRILQENRVTSSYRNSFGHSIDAACGQLFAGYEEVASRAVRSGHVCYAIGHPLLEEFLGEDCLEVGRESGGQSATDPEDPDKALSGTT